MFKSQTVFVVGAGASCEASLPNGRELRDRIARALDIRFEWNRQESGDYRIAHYFREFVKGEPDRNGDINPLLHKCWQIRDMVPVAAISIDNYLDAHRGDKDLELCGKLGIVKCILDAESRSKLRYKDDHRDRFSLRDLSDTWYVSFLQLLTENVAKEDVASAFENISIITFNYDRIIEHFLAQGLADYYVLGIEETQRLVAQLRIFHPYGQVGPLPWQDRQSGVRFGDHEQSDLLAISRQIKTFTEGMDDQNLMEAIHQCVFDAETMVFLGFAFHPQNLELILPQEAPSLRRVFASVMGVSKSDQDAIKRDLRRALGRDGVRDEVHNELEIEMHDGTCADFFRYYWRSLPAVA